MEPFLYWAVLTMEINMHWLMSKLYSVCGVPNKQLKRTKYAVTFFAKTRKKTAIKFCPLAGR